MDVSTELSLTAYPPLHISNHVSVTLRTSVRHSAALQVLECIAPGSDDIVLPKTSSNVFSSTNVDYILRSLEKRYLILAGCVTDQCVESAVREACDRHYYVTQVTGELCQS